MRRLVERLGAIGLRMGTVAAILGGIIPETVDGDLTPEQEREAEERFRREVESLERINGRRPRRYGTDDRGLGGDIVVNEPTLPGGIGPPTWEQLPPGGAASSSAPEREGLVVRVRRGLARNLENIVLGAIGLGTLSLLRRGSSTSPLTVNIPQATLSPTTADLTRVQTQTLPFAVGSLSTRTGQETCECKAKRKQKKRKCLERAQIEWRSGRYKGKLAGTKCVRFAKE